MGEETAVELWKAIIEPFDKLLGESVWRWLTLVFLAFIVTAWIFRRKIADWIRKERFTEHDTALFKSLDAIMTEAQLRDFISMLEGGHYTDDYSMLASRLEHKAEAIETTFLDRKISKLFKRFIKELGELHLFVATQFFSIGKGDMSAMQPELKARAYAGIPEDSKRWKDLRFTLIGHCKRTSYAYEKYRKAVKRGLQV